MDQLEADFEVTETDILENISVSRVRIKAP